jgi:hypothetical protein
MDALLCRKLWVAAEFERFFPAYTAYVEEAHAMGHTC